jgi:hypothetical protein
LVQVTEIEELAVASVVARLEAATEPNASVAVELMVQLAVIVIDTVRVPVAVPA